MVLTTSLHLRLVGDPVDLPCLTAVLGEGLLEVRRGRQVRPAKADQDGFAVDGVLREELAHTILKLTNLRRIEDANLLVVPVKPPLVRLGIVDTQGQADDASSRAIPLALVDLRVIEDCAADAFAFELDPLVRAGERMQTPLQVVRP